MSTAMVYAIKFVANMDDAIVFHHRQLGLPLRFQSPEWSEFDTGSTTLALHIADANHPAGTYQLGFRVNDLEDFTLARRNEGREIVQEPTASHGSRIAKFRYADGSEFSVSAR